MYTCHTVMVTISDNNCIRIKTIPEEHGVAGVQLGAVLAVELPGGGAVREAALLAAGAGVHLHLLAPLALALK